MNISVNVDVDTEAVRHIQREGAAALLAANIETARRIYADDFQVVRQTSA